MKTYNPFEKIMREYLSEQFDKNYKELREMPGYEQFRNAYVRNEKSRFQDPLSKAYQTSIIDVLKKYNGNIGFGLCAFIDLDKLKQMNDKYGHKEGDEYIQYVSQKINEGLLEGDILIRKGGDEFLIMSTRHNGKLKNAQEYYKQLLKRIDEEIKRKYGNDYGISFGLAEIDHNQPGWQAIVSAINTADRNMYNYKKTKKLLKTPHK